MKTDLKLPLLPCSLGLWDVCFSFDNVFWNSCILSLAFLSKIRRRLIIICLRLVPVVQRVDSAIPAITQQVVVFIHWIALSILRTIIRKVISCPTLKQEGCLRTFSIYLLLQYLFPSRAVVFLYADFFQNSSTASFPVWRRAIHQTCNFLPSLGELFSFFLRKRMTPLLVKEIEGSVKALSANWINT